MIKKNNELIKVGNSKTVTVTIVMDVDVDTPDAVTLRNAGEAAKWLANTGTLHNWVRKVAIDERR
jgi:hypothetical protein